MRSSIQWITVGTCKTKAIREDLEIFTYIPAKIDIFRQYSGILRYEVLFIIRYYSGMFGRIHNPTIFRPRGTFRTLVCSEPEAYSKSETLEPCQISTMGHFCKIVHGYNYFS